MPNPPRSRPFAAADAEAAAHIHALCFAHDPWPPKAFLELLNTGAEGFIASLQGDAIGLILTRTAADEAEILTFAVLSARRGQGVGQALLDDALQSLRANGTERLLLEVAKTNHAAVSLYTKSGFTVVGERGGYYGGPEGPVDAYIMLKQLNDSSV